MNQQAFNLLEEPWVGVIDADGKHRYVGLRSLFNNAHRASSILLETPPQTAAVLRLATAITYKISRLNDPSIDWQEKRAECISRRRFEPEAIADYFDRWEDRFFLFHPSRPFAQDPRLGPEAEKIRVSEIGKLAFHIPAGNNVSWFGAKQNSLEIPDSASWLLAALCFSSGGMVSPRQGEKASKQAPARGRVTFHFTGSNLFETLLANLGRNTPDTKIDSLPWEADLPKVDKDAVLTADQSADAASRSLGRWRHAFLLEQNSQGKVDGVRSTWAHRNVDEVDDPHLVYFFKKVSKTKRERKNLQADMARSMWRDLPTLRANPNIATDSSQENGLEIQKTLQGMPDEHSDFDRDDFVERIGVTVFGYSSDKSTDFLWWSATTPKTVGAWIAGADLDRYEIVDEFVKKVERQRKSLRRALGTSKTDHGEFTFPKKLSEQAGAQFLQQAETLFWQCASSLELPDHESVRRSLRSLALEAFDHATFDFLLSPRSAAATAHGRSIVSASLRPQQEPANV